jgi:aerobic C4-dicarboxylate transport protein
MAAIAHAASRKSKSFWRQSFWRQAWVHVVIAAAMGAVLGALSPSVGVAMKPAADGFIALIKLTIPPLIFLVVANGVAQVGDLRKVGRIGLKTIIYFEAVTTVALLLGGTVGNLVDFGSAVQRPSAQQAETAARFVQSKAQSLPDFILGIIPDNLFGAFVHDNVLQVLVIALLAGAALVKLGDRGAPIRDALGRGSELVFGVVNIIVLFAPIGAFGALGFTVGRFGVQTLYALGLFVLTAWLTLAFLVFIVFDLICWMFGFRVLHLIRLLKEEAIMVIATSSSEVAIPGMIEKLQKAGVSSTAVGLVIPTGYSFNLDGVAITLPMSLLFIAQVYGIHLDFWQQVSLLVLMLFTSKGAAGVTGGAFAALAATVVASGLPVEGLALLLGVDRFMSQGRSITNMIGNAVAAVVVAKWDGEFDAELWKATSKDALTTVAAVPSAAGLGAAPAGATAVASQSV